MLTTALCDVLCENACVTIHTYHGCCAMREWLHTQSFKPSVSVASGLPNFESESIELAVVVNAARDHEATIEKCLNAGVAVLSEKPVTVSYAATNRLIALAEDKNVSLSPAHVFLFANYLQKFSDILPDRRDIKSIQFEWEDPLVEARYGEAKTYDAGLPIYIDCLPHVLSIIDMLVPNMVHAVNDLKFRRGGADLIIESILGNIPCQIKLVRNGVCRKRLVTVMADKQYQVDFTTEPGHIAVN
ncbi:MAG: Gfo/Idh/MocA family oxidoreductase, partial [Gammaproteobacteria bacterium]|nr:Gfo/Idh/MocA family oxidoreductase [Gammaproteobacteria bacterium]